MAFLTLFRDSSLMWGNTLSELRHRISVIKCTCVVLETGMFHWLIHLGKDTTNTVKTRSWHSQFPPLASLPYHRQQKQWKTNQQTSKHYSVYEHLLYAKKSLIKFCCFTQDLSPPVKLLAPSNIDQSKLLEYVTDVVQYATKGTLKKLELKIVGNNQPDIAAFDFTSIKKAEHAARIIERKGSKLLVGLVGDSLLEVSIKTIYSGNPPFLWPEQKLTRFYIWKPC